MHKIENESILFAEQSSNKVHIIMGNFVSFAEMILYLSCKNLLIHMYVG